MLGLPVRKISRGKTFIFDFLNIERRNGANKPVIRKALVELDGAPFKFFASKREQWAKETSLLEIALGLASF